MISKEVINYSLKNLLKNKSRNMLTILSIFIGITTIFIFVSFGQGLYDYIEDMTESATADNIIIQGKGMSSLGGDFKLTEEDLEEVIKTTGIYEAAGATFKVAKIQKNGQVKYAYLTAYDPQKKIIEETFNTEIIKGGRLSSRDKNKVVLGYNYLLEDRVFDSAYEINDKIKIQEDEAKVTGFFNEIGNPQDDSNVYITQEYFEELYPDDKGYNWIVGKIDIKNKEIIIENVEDNLRDSRDLEEGEEDFYVQTFEDMIESYSSTLNIVVAFVIFIALLSILVSVINTSNTMITSVLERTKEIGIIKSIGAKNSEIFNIFLFESGVIGLISGLIGIILGFVLSYIGGKILSQLGYGFLQPAFPFWLFAGCLAFAIVTGAVSGVLPARNASKVNPVDALRHE